MSDNDEAVRLDIRLSGQIERYHTWPTIRRQTIAEHCWHLMRIYLCVVDKTDPHMIRHIMFHDIGETAIGDMPYPVKSENHDLKKAADYIEDQSRLMQLEHWDSFRQTFLSKEDKKLFKDIELIEMAEFGLDEMCLGNSHGHIIADRCLKKVFYNSPSTRLMQYVMKRIDMFSAQYKNTLLTDPAGDWWFSQGWRDLITHGIKLEVKHASE